MCQQCILDLTNCHTFIDKCQKSQETLQIMLNNMQNAIIIKTEIGIKTNEEKEDSEINEATTTIQNDKSDKPFCKHCNTLFEDMHQHKEHIKITKHPKAKNFHCEICKKCFRSRDPLNDHMRTHTKEKPFLCNYCPAKFTNRANLRRHHMIHSGEKPHICEICQKSKYKVWYHL